ncbi:MAG: FAD-binding oxidoreductase [Gammaproteobacteria bacterium]
MDRAALLAALAAAAGADALLVDEVDTERYLVDERRLYRGRALAVVRPATRAAVAEVVRVCAAARVPMVPQGGNTGYCGGATPDASGTQLVLSLERLNRVIEVDAVNASMTLEAGVVLATAQAAAAAAGLLMPLSMGSEGSCQIGGNLATNAGGLAVLRYGTARELCLGLEVVLPDGSVLEQLAGLRKDNTGYDLARLFIGAEGTLGIITAATLKLFPRPRARATVFAAVSDAPAACALLARLRAAVGDGVTTFEYLSAAALEHALRATGERAPLDTAAGHFVLVEWVGFDDADMDGRAAALLAPWFEAGLVCDAVVAANEAQRAALWRLRESVPAGEKLAGGSVKHDVSVRIGDVPALIEAAGARIAAGWPAARLSVYGHVGDGNVHFNVLAPAGADADEFRARHAAAISEAVHDAAAALGGSFSAEHGVGQLKRAALASYAGGARLAAMAAVKAALDPHGLMNPGKVL